MKAALVTLALLLVAPMSVSADEFNPDGWTHLGTKKVKPGKKVSLEVAGSGFYDELTFVAEGSDLKIDKVSVEAGGLAHIGRPEATSLQQLTISVTTASEFEVRIWTKGKAKRAGKVHVYARASSRPAPVKLSTGPATLTPAAGPATAASIVPVGRPYVAPEPTVDDSFTLDGWTLLGEDEVDLIDDVVEIKRKKKATWGQIALVAAGDPFHVEAVELTLGGKKKKKKVQREEVAKDFAGEDSVRVIEIAGSRRAVSKVRLQYKKYRLDASSRVQIYAR